MTITTRPATAGDAAGMCELLNAIIALGGTTAHRSPFDPERMLHHYIAPARGIATTVALDDEMLVGFQALLHPNPDYPGDAALGDGWAIIATFVAGGQQGRGIGHKLFAETQQVARATGVRHIDATIRRENTGGQRFYASLGFIPDRESANAVSKRFDL